MHQGWIRVVWALLLSSIAVVVASAVTVAVEPGRVVLLYDERTDLPGLAILDASLAASLTAGLPGVEIYREPLDLSRFGGDGYLAQVRSYLRAKYAGRKIDVVVAAMGPSLDFLLDSPDRVFPGAPIVFCGLDRREIDSRALPDDVTGVLLRREFAPTLRSALQLLPDTTRVVVVAGTSEFDVLLLEQARAELRSFEHRVAFTYLTSRSLRDLLGELARLPPHTVVLYTTMFRDGAGEAFVPHDVAERVSGAANAPVFAFNDQYLGRGIVGGRLYSLEAHGQQAAGLALRILQGTRPSELPLIEGTTGAYQFDVRQLQRWQIDETRLPAGSAVRFRQPSLWESHRSEILTFVGIVTFQMLLIIALLSERSIRRRAQDTLRDSETRLYQSNEQVRTLAGQLITAQEVERARIAREIHDNVGQQLAGFTISLSGLKREAGTQQPSLQTGLTALQARAITLSEEIRHISHDLHPGVLKHVGLVAALRSHCEDFAKLQQIAVTVTAEGELGVLDAATQLCLYRVTQEALRNVVKHSGALNVEVGLSRFAHEVMLSITDNGRGFDLEAAGQHGGGLGLRSIDERVRTSSGRLAIESAPGQGTRISVRLPVAP